MAVKIQTGIDLNGQQARNSADGTLGTDLATWQQVQNLVAGLSWKDEVLAATTGNVTLSGLTNGATLDGVTLATGNRILVKNQTTGADNGIYVVQSTAAPIRSADADATAELENATVSVSQGTVNADKAYTQTATITTVGTTAQTWVSFGAGITYTNGNGLALNSNAFSILLDPSGSGLSLSGAGLKVDYSLMTRTIAFDCAATTNPQTFTHNLAKIDHAVTIREQSSGAIVYCDVVCGANSDTVNFGVAPSAAQFRVVVVG